MTTRVNEVRTAVREHYGKVAEGEAGCCADGGCGGNPEASRRMGYTDADLADAPGGANLGLGCGNPRAIAALQLGETVLDLGSGAGFDAFLAARAVGPTGQVIGVDMTPQMVERARANATRGGYTNVEFRLGEIERLPVPDASVDVIMSNCVVNLSPDKAAVIREAFRVLKPAGRLAISDIVATAVLPADLRDDVSALTGCVAGATPVAELETLLRDAGFEAVRVTLAGNTGEIVREWMPGVGLDRYVASASIEAVRPAAGACCGPSCCGESAAS